MECSLYEFKKRKQLVDYSSYKHIAHTSIENDKRKCDHSEIFKTNQIALTKQAILAHKHKELKTFNGINVKTTVLSD